MNSQPQITVAICTRNRPALLEQCLSALAKQTYPHFEVLVVDNASSHPVRHICERWSARYAHEPVPGVARASNRAVAEARGEVIAFIDDDAVAQVDWLEKLAEEFSAPEIDAVTGSIQYMQAHGDSRRMSGQCGEFTLRPRAVFDRSTPGWFRVACFGGIGDGSNMAFRRRVFRSALRFEERLGRGRVLDGGFEHVALMQLIEAGGRVLHCPESKVTHPTPSLPAIAHQVRIQAFQTSIAYLIFLWAEFPRYRLELCRFVGCAIAKRFLRLLGALPSPARVPFYRAAWVCAKGVWQYWRARSEWHVPQSAAHLEYHRVPVEVEPAADRPRRALGLVTEPPHARLAERP